MTSSLYIIFLTGCISMCPRPAPIQDPGGSGAPSQPAPDVLIQVAHLRYGRPLTSSQCFSTGYLQLLNRESTIRASAEPITVDLADDELFTYPFVILSGEGDFTFTDEEIAALRHYLETGGFILASSGCSNSNWNSAFQREMPRFLPSALEGDAPAAPVAPGPRPLAEYLAQYEFQALPLNHPVFHTVFDITSFETKKIESASAETRLFALKRNGRLAMIYSPEGLNDTGNAGGGCCCCGGNELRNAKYINANILAYVLTGN